MLHSFHVSTVRRFPSHRAYSSPSPLPPDLQPQGRLALLQGSCFPLPLSRPVFPHTLAFPDVTLRSGRERRARPRRWRMITSSCLASSSRSSSSSTRWHRAGAAIATRSLPIATPPHPSLPLLSSGGGLHACSTSTYKLHYFETASGPSPCRHSRLSRYVSLRRGPCSLCRPPLRPLHRRIPASARAACHRQTPKGRRRSRIGLAAGDLRETLRRLYADIYVETLTKNPLHRLDEPITCKSFEQAVDAFFASLQQGQG